MKAVPEIASSLFTACSNIDRGGADRYLGMYGKLPGSAHSTLSFDTLLSGLFGLARNPFRLRTAGLPPILIVISSGMSPTWPGCQVYTSFPSTNILSSATPKPSPYSPTIRCFSPSISTVHFLLLRSSFPLARAEAVHFVQWVSPTR